MQMERLILSNNGSVTVSSSPSCTRDERGLSKFGRVALSSAGGLGMYNVVPLALTMLGDDRRNDPSFSVDWIHSLTVLDRGTFILSVVCVQTGQSSFC